MIVIIERAAAVVTALVAVVVIVWAVRALFFRDLGQRARPRRDRDDVPGWGERPPEIAAEPARFAPAPMPEFSYGPDPGWAKPEQVVPANTHDEYALPQRWHPRLPAVPARPVTAGLHTATLVIFAAAVVQQHAWRLEVLEAYEWLDRWPGDGTGMRAIEGGA